MHGNAGDESVPSSGRGESYQSPGEQELLLAVLKRFFISGTGDILSYDIFFSYPRLTIVMVTTRIITEQQQLPLVCMINRANIQFSCEMEDIVETHVCKLCVTI